MFLAAAFLLAAQTDLFACATCFGKSDSPLAKGMNWGIATLLIVVVVMWSGVAAFFIHIARRAGARAGAETAPAAAPVKD